VAVSADDSLRDQLRRSDPASSLEPLADEDVSLLLGQAMAAPSRPRLMRYAKPVAAVVSLAAAVVVAFAVLSGDPQPVVERVTASSGAVAKCVPPSAEELRKADVAVEGTVQSIKGGVVRLTIAQVWAGPKADVLEVAQSDGASESTEFAVGRTYLVAAEGGQVRGCGYTGLVSPELRTLYGAAF
jgi:hypothetical protein